MVNLDLYFNDFMKGEIETRNKNIISFLNKEMGNEFKYKYNNLSEMEIDNLLSYDDNLFEIVDIIFSKICKVEKDYKYYFKEKEALEEIKINFYLKLQENDKLKKVIELGSSFKITSYEDYDKNMSNKGPDSNQCSIKTEKLNPIIYHSSKLLLCRLHRLQYDILCCKKNIKKYNESSKLKEEEMVIKERKETLLVMVLISFIVGVLYKYYYQ
ncbi:hypothetical protein HERIO_2497 [Hepatospora eriocheir]|uniref:Uncharacterized protein n=1 Tax=Hepatospora eriocheir TaxID=1081669 RepID=A0A1X0Q6Q7_9MICR|nr:hypothetical protein HERIO_2497 [Hepatospora eriocheir]